MNQKPSGWQQISSVSFIFIFQKSERSRSAGWEVSTHQYQPPKLLQSLEMCVCVQSQPVQASTHRISFKAPCCPFIWASVMFGSFNLLLQFQQSKTTCVRLNTLSNITWLLLTSWQRSWGNNSRIFLERLCTFPHKMKHKCDIEAPTLGQNKLFSLLKKFKYRKSSKEFKKIYFSPMVTKPPSVSFSHGNFTESKETKNDCFLPTKVK